MLAINMTDVINVLNICKPYLIALEILAIWRFRERNRKEQQYEEEKVTSI